jgi:hypothetical protein
VSVDVCVCVCVCARVCVCECACVCESVSLSLSLSLSLCVCVCGREREREREREGGERRVSLCGSLCTSFCAREVCVYSYMCAALWVSDVTSPNCLRKKLVIQTSIDCFSIPGETERPWQHSRTEHDCLKEIPIAQLPVLDGMFMTTWSHAWRCFSCESNAVTEL